MILTIKKIIAFLCNILGVSKLCFNHLNKKYNNNYVRVINYHNTEKEYIELFDKHLTYLENKFEIIDFDTFKLFLEGKYTFKDKPGMMISFDDGFISNYEYGLDILDKHNIKALFFISSNKKGETDSKYISHKQLIEIQNKGHIIGDHTKNHYRFKDSDDNEKLKEEIIDSKKELESLLNVNINCFCYVGGEVPVYTDKSFEMIKNNYDYCFTTLTKISDANTNRYMIHRTNVESFWNLGLVKFQTSGLWDYLYKNKAKSVEEKLLK